MIQETPQADDDFTPCTVCGADMDYTDCWSCGGEGSVDLHEQYGLEYAPGEYEVCEICEGEGGYPECPLAETHQGKDVSTGAL